MLQRAKSFIIRPKKQNQVYDESDSSHLRRTTVATSSDDIKQLQELTQKMNLEEKNKQDKERRKAFTKRTFSFRSKHKSKNGNT